MSNTINADQGTDAMAQALQDAADDLEAIAGENTKLLEQFEHEGWSGLDQLQAGDQHLNAVRDALTAVAEKIGVGGAIVRDAHSNNAMIKGASKASLGHE